VDVELSSSGGKVCHYITSVNILFCAFTPYAFTSIPWYAMFDKRVFDMAVNCCWGFSIRHLFHSSLGY
jgi:hypothetical protein